ncbi:hypothetical protein AB5T19_000834 [Escherichia coli]|nr:hypothetical protein [Escherichia coli O53]HCX5860662.1 hypothetical protein [Escherichia coli]
MKQKFIEWFTKNNNGCSPAMEDDRRFVHEKAQHMFEAYQAGVAEGEARCAALAAENAGLKQFPDQIVGFIGKLGSSEIGSETKEKIQAAEKRIAELEAREKSLRTVGVMSQKAFQRLEGRESRFIALWPRPEIYLPRKRPEDGVIVYARVAGTGEGE